MIHIETFHFIIKFQCQTETDWKLCKHILGNECNVCQYGWSCHAIGASTKCLFTTKSKIATSQVENFCRRLNATVPYPKTYQENQNYRHAFNSMNISSSVAIKSCHGIVKQNRNSNWNPFPTNGLANVACEKIVGAGKTRFRRQAKSGLIPRIVSPYQFIYQKCL